MIGQTPPQLTNPSLDWVEGALQRQAGRLGLLVRTAPEFGSVVFRGGQDSSSAKLESSDLPSETRGIKVGRYAVLIGQLPDMPSSEAVIEALRRYRNQCVIARSYLSPNEALDLQLFLIGPRGSEPANDWQPLALYVERDDRVARKLCWLRPTIAAADEASFSDFLNRTFMARPWIHEAIFSMAALDNFNRAATAVGDVPRDTVGEWVRLAQTKRNDPDALVDGLVGAWTRRGHV